MENRKGLRFVFLAIVLGATVGNAQEPHQHHHDSTEKLGLVNFPVSCSPAEQQRFNRALSLLHSFQYVDAEAAFAEITASQPSCAMAWWGQAMSFYHPLWLPPTPAELQKGQQAIAKARTAGAKTPREGDYIGALETFYRDAERVNHWERARAYAAAMEGVYRRYPRDREAGIFYALALNGTAPASELNLVNRNKAAGILYRVWPAEPDHPGIAHYLIHTYDYPSLAHLGLRAARRYAKVAPSSAHALHMPSHIFTRLGMWSESVLSNLASATAAKQHISNPQPAKASQDQLHAMDYLMYAYLQGAQDDRAKSILDEARGYSEIDQVVFQAGYAWTAIPARFALERHRWDEAAALTPHPAAFPWDRFPFATANLHFARAIGAARSGKAEMARQEIAKLASIRAALGSAGGGYDWGKQVQIQHQAAAAWHAQMEGKGDEAERLLRAAAELEDSTDKHPVTPGAILPAREMLGDVLIELKQPARALREYETVLLVAPNRFNSLFGAARAAELSGNRQKARMHYAKLLSVCAKAQSDRPELRQAKAYLARK